MPTLGCLLQAEEVVMLCSNNTLNGEMVDDVGGGGDGEGGSPSDGFSMKNLLWHDYSIWFNCASNQTASGVGVVGVVVLILAARNGVRDHAAALLHFMGS
ncbi:hypothetical protein ZIOFF_042556 [Zingiber officinale]|uniref:Uncharacterized protein n=1 Tax=Zingiber officinale TaxID=94328 RepID=A0A8J5FRU3_ZINOF|nr:hypothetical protein ZIOFF_042556 [Zingiber officinale]